MSDTSEAASPAASVDYLESRQNGGAPIYRAYVPPVPPQYLPGGRKSLNGISIRAFALGTALGLCSLLTVELAYLGYGIWRAPFFIAILALFHYLEFDMTARYNPSDAQTSSFLLLSNGSAYSIAHASAMTEFLLRYWLHSKYAPVWLSLPFQIPQFLPTTSAHVPVLLGMMMIVVGQYVRSAAMREAGTSFNHIVQSTKKDDHVLVTSGVYAFCRHPSYFGFFWWGLGTQLVLENPICFVAYAVVLWRFFSRRIIHEERHLVQFFGQAYERYRSSTSVLIPFIR